MTSSISGNSLGHFSGLSLEQQEVVGVWGEGMAVMAGAGSGKTTTLVAKCARLLEINPKARFAAVSFTERSASDLRSRLSSILHKIGAGTLHSHWVTTIHGLCGSIIREYPREAGLDGEESVLAEADSQLLWERAIDALWLDPLTDEVRLSLEHLLNRESRDGLATLLRRVRDLAHLGALEILRMSPGSSPDSSKRASEQALGKAAQFVLDRYERMKRRQGAIDFNDLERGADRALKSEAVRESYRHRFDLVLVDEFQDTNPVQAGIIWRMARPKLTNLCVVGDPKQSIYRFRDADVTVFQEYCSQLPVKQSLTRNYRSLPGIIEFANQVCEPAFQASDMSFESLIPIRGSLPKAGADKGACEDQGQDSVVRLDVQRPEDLADWIREEVQRGIPLQDFTLLVRKIRGNEKWIKALASRGIPIAVGSGGLFWEDPRIRELVSFLKWWDNPGHALSGAIFLRAPWMKLSDTELDEWVIQDPHWKKPFFKSTHPVALALKKFTQTHARPGELLLTLLENPEIEDELGAQLLGLWHRVEELSSRGLDFHGVVMELSTAVQENRREKEVPAPRNLGQLSILTIHGSKGLEFPHVILIDFGDKARAPDMPLLFWDRQKGIYLGGRDENGDRDRTDPVEVNWRELEKEKNLAESKRLFYVALTRARERLILVCPELKNAKDSAKDSTKDSTKDSRGSDLWKQDYWRAWIEGSGVELPAARKEGGSSSPHPIGKPPSDPLRRNDPIPRSPSKVRNSRVRHSVTEWTLLSRCGRAYEWKFIRPAPLITPSNPTVKEAADLGTRVHRCLERVDLEGLKKLQAEVGSDRFLAGPVLEWASRSPWMAPPTAASMTPPRVTERGGESISQTVHREVWTELAFEVPMGGEVLVGSIDRLICEERDGAKHYSIIDFKVSESQKSERALAQIYQTQIELYAWALTALDPRIKLQDISAYLVNISYGAVQTVRVSLGKVDLEALVKESVALVDGKQGEPMPGNPCRFCEFHSQCDKAVPRETSI